MSDLYKATKQKKGGFSVMESGGAEFIKHLRKLENGSKVVIDRTVSDYAKRAPAWISKGVRKHYGVDAAAIKDAHKNTGRGKTNIKISGIEVAGASIEFEGRKLTPTHFKMSPAARPEGVKKYRVSAKILKSGKRSKFPKSVFLARATKKAGEGSATIIPWQRIGDGRLPVAPLKTLAVAQMAGGFGGDNKEHTNRATVDVKREIDIGLTKRFNNHIKQQMK